MTRRFTTLTSTMSTSCSGGTTTRRSDDVCSSNNSYFFLSFMFDGSSSSSSSSCCCRKTTRCGLILMCFFLSYVISIAEATIEYGGMDDALQTLLSLSSIYREPPSWMDGTSFTFGKTTYIRSAGIQTIENDGLTHEEKQKNRHQQQEQLFQVSPIMYNGLNYEGKPTKVFAWLSLPVDYEGTDSNNIHSYETTSTNNSNNSDGTSSTQNINNLFQPYSGIPVPAVVLIHGRGGTAYKKWCGHWAWRGYASLVIAHEGQTDVVLGKEHFGPSIDPNNLYQKHAWAGPNYSSTTSSTNFGKSNVQDTYMFHALADTVLGNTLLRSFWDRINVNQIGIMGIGDIGVSISTNVVSGIDTRFSYMMSSHYYSDHEERIHSLSGMNALLSMSTSTTSSSNSQLWDPTERLHLIKVPTFWSILWPQNKSISGNKHLNEITKYTNTISSSSLSSDGQHKPYTTMSFVLEGITRSNENEDYSEGQPTRETLVWSRPEVYAFANSVLDNEFQDVWAREVHSSYSTNADDDDNSILHLIIFDSSRTLRDAQLVYTTTTSNNNDVSSSDEWIVIPVTKMEQLDCHYELSRCHWKVVTTIPSNAKQWFFNMFTVEGGLNLSSKYYNRDTLFKDSSRRKQRKRNLRRKK